MHRMIPTCVSTKDLSKPSNYKSIIIEQNRLIEKLQAKVQKLQIQVSPKSKSYILPDSDSFKITTETNTSCSIYNSRTKPDKTENSKGLAYNHTKPSEKVPKIYYSSSSDSSDEENIKDLQCKYLTINKNV